MNSWAELNFSDFFQILIETRTQRWDKGNSKVLSTTDIDLDLSTSWDMSLYSSLQNEEYPIQNRIWKSTIPLSTQMRISILYLVIYDEL
jgi:hypothetical protein